jgi:DNA repair and recombination protein RAD54B
MAEDEEPARVAPLSPKPTNTVVRPAVGVRAPFKRPGAFNNPRAAFKKPFRSPMVNAPVDRAVPMLVPRVSDTKGAPAEFVKPGHMAPFIGKPRPQVGLAPIKRPNPIASARPMVPTKGPDASQKLYFGALYAKRKAAKNRSSKSWMDGIVVNQDPTTTLMDMTGKIVAKGKAGTCVEGTTMEIGNWEVEVQDAVSEESFLSGAALAGGSTGPTPSLPNVTAAAPAPFRPAVGSIRGGVSSQKLIKPPLFDPTREGAVVLSTPGTSFPEGESNTTVVIDPFVGVHLRPHQRAGVKFMFECVTGLRRGGISVSTHRGCLLAHEMGMGKDPAGHRAAVDAAEAGPDRGETCGSEGCHRVPRVAGG